MSECEFAVVFAFLIGVAVTTLANYFIKLYEDYRNEKKRKEIE
jgi:hypothetical protein